MTVKIEKVGKASDHFWLVKDAKCDVQIGRAWKDGRLYKG